MSSKTKCKKGESKLSWSSEGPAGKAGANGAPGATGKEGTAGKEGASGKNGAAAGFSASQSELQVLNSAPAVEILSKTLPAGSYLTAAKVETRALATSNGFVAVGCEIWDESTTSRLDEAEGAGGLGEFEAGKFGFASTLPLQAAVSSSKSIELQVWCYIESDTPDAEIVAVNGQLSAVQTSSNG